MTKPKKEPKKRELPVSLHPLTPEQAIKGLWQVDPKAVKEEEASARRQKGAKPKPE